MLVAQVTLATTILVIALCVGVWDIMCYAQGKPEYTVSTIIGYWASEVPALPLAVGFIMGHLFWPRLPWKPPSPPLTMASLCVIAIGALAWLFSL